MSDVHLVVLLLLLEIRIQKPGIFIGLSRLPRDANQDVEIRFLKLPRQALGVNADHPHNLVVLRKHRNAHHGVDLQVHDGLSTTEIGVTGGVRRDHALFGLQNVTGDRPTQPNRCILFWISMFHRTGHHLARLLMLKQDAPSIR